MHSLILGITKSGKSYFAKSLAQLSKQRKRRVVVLDPLRDEWQGADFVTSDLQEFISVLKSNENCDAYADETGMTIGRGKVADSAQWLATPSRPCGHKFHFLVQPYSFLDFKIRSYCEYRKGTPLNSLHL